MPMRLSYTFSYESVTLPPLTRIPSSVLEPSISSLEAERLPPRTRMPTSLSKKIFCVEVTAEPAKALLTTIPPAAIPPRNPLNWLPLEIETVALAVARTPCWPDVPSPENELPEIVPAPSIRIPIPSLEKELPRVPPMLMDDPVETSTPIASFWNVV